MPKFKVVPNLPSHYAKGTSLAMDNLLKGLAINLYNTNNSSSAKRLYNLAVNLKLELEKAGVQN